VSEVTRDLTVGHQTEVIVLTGAMRDNDEPDCRPARRWIRPRHLILRDECVVVVVGDELLYFLLC
jgi:hypothetical protein